MLPIFCEISGLLRGVDGVFAVLSCYAVHMESSFPAFRNSLSVPSWRLKKMDPMGCPETSLTTTNVSCVTAQKGEFPSKT